AASGALDVGAHGRPGATLIRRRALPFVLFVLPKIVLTPRRRWIAVVSHGEPEGPFPVFAPHSFMGSCEFAVNFAPDGRRSVARLGGNHHCGSGRIGWSAQPDAFSRPGGIGPQCETNPSGARPPAPNARPRR
ncbi:MAG: hypothetical protein N3G20_11465, partial [Verrucomicrobiae bacterium]|nr:hypothetical protein [Verrucomicrobiae bacterium]